MGVCCVLGRVIGWIGRKRGVADEENVEVMREIFESGAGLGVAHISAVAGQ